MNPRVITYQITLLEPALVTALDGDPNSAVAYPYLPGSVLRGALIAAFLAGSDVPADKLLSDETATRLFFGGTVCYLNGYPWDGRYRALPTPRSWQHDKRLSLEDVSAVDFVFREDDPYDETPWDGVEQPFAVLDAAEGRAGLLKPLRQVAVHTQRDPVYGRPRSNEGQVYRYDALAAGQVFGAAIVLDANANPQADGDVARLQQLLSQETMIGGSRSGGYGRVRFTGVQVVKPGAHWREAGQQDITQPDEHLVVTLTSDALVRDTQGQHTTAPQVIVDHLSAQLGNGVVVELGRAFVRGRVVGGFNRRWGLPLPQTVAAQMGSVLELRVSNCPANALRALEWKGIGERRTEGFGRVVVNWQRGADVLAHACPIARAGETGSQLSSAIGRALADRMVTRRWRKELDAAVLARASQLGPLIKQPRKSQLARLRMSVHGALRQPPASGRSALDRYLKSLSDRPVTRRQFEHDRVQGKSLLEWLRARTRDEKEIWNDLGVGPSPALGDIRASNSTELAYEYNLRLIDAVLARAAKEKKE